MGTLKPQSLANLAGSLNNGVRASEIADNEWATLRNFFQNETGLTRRPPANRITTSPVGAATLITGMFAFKESSGTWTLMVGTPGGLSKMVGTAFSAIALYGAAIPPTPDPWVTAQYKDYTLWARKNTGLYRATTSILQPAGIAAPVVAPIITTGSAGAILAGAYYMVFTYHNSVTDAESDYSPVSLVYNAPGGAKIDWNNLTPSVNPQVDRIRLYRTLVNQPGEYYFVDSKPNDGTGSYLGDNFLTNALGAPASIKNGLPPSDIACVVMWKERAFCHNGVDVLYSEYQRPESFWSESFIPIFPDDGHQIRGLHPWGDRLFVGKTNACHLLLSPDGFQFEVSERFAKAGCWSHHSIKSTREGIIWYGGDDFYLSTGGEATAIGDTKIRTILDAIPSALKEFVVAGLWPKLGWYVASVPAPGQSSPNGSANSLLLVYNFKTRVWTTFDYQYGPSNVGGASGNYTGAPRFLADFFDSTYGPHIYATFEDGHAWDLIAPGTNHQLAAGGGGNIFSMEAISKAYAYGQPGALHELRNIRLSSSDSIMSLTCALRRDLSPTDYVTRTIPLSGLGAWKPIRVSTHHAAAYLTQLRFAVAAADPTLFTTPDEDFTLSELTFDVIESAARIRRMV